MLWWWLRVDMREDLPVVANGLALAAGYERFGGGEGRRACFLLRVGYLQYLRWIICPLRILVGMILGWIPEYRDG